MKNASILRYFYAGIHYFYITGTIAKQKSFAIFQQITFCFIIFIL